MAGVGSAETAKVPAFEPAKRLWCWVFGLRSSWVSPCVLFRGADHKQALYRDRMHAS